MAVSVRDITEGGVDPESSWNGCGETPGFSEFRYGQSTEYHPDARFRSEVPDIGEGTGGYGGGAPGDHATVVEAPPRTS